MIICSVRKQYVTQESWDEASKLNTTAKIKAKVREIRSDLVIEDVFRFRQDAASLSVMLRIRSSQLGAWLTDKTSAHDQFSYRGAS